MSGEMVTEFVTCMAKVAHEMGISVVIVATKDRFARSMTKAHTTADAMILLDGLTGRAEDLRAQGYTPMKPDWSRKVERQNAAIGPEDIDEMARMTEREGTA